MTYKLPEPDMRGPCGTGDYFNGYTANTLRSEIAAAEKRGREQREKELLAEDGEMQSEIRSLLEQLAAARLQGARSHDASDMRPMLAAMQAGEMTVSRGLELLDMWLAGNYMDDQLPPVRDTLPDDVMPWDEIKRLRALQASAVNQGLLIACKEAEPMLAAMLKNITDHLPQYSGMPALDAVRAAIAAAEAHTGEQT